MPSGHPSDMVPTDWYTAARTIDQNRATNEAFRSSYQTPSVALTPSRPATFNTIWFQAPEWSANHQHAPTPRNPVPMDIDASQKTQPLPFSCYRYRKAGYKAPDCPTQFEIWELSIDDLQTYLEDCLVELDVKHLEPAAEVEEQDFSCRKEWTAHPRCHITIVSLFYLHVPLMKQLNCHGLCLVTFFPKNNQRMAPTESPMMATSPLFSATITIGHPRQTYIGAPSEYFPYSNTTNTTCILIIVITNQHHVLSTAAQPEPHHASHTFHIPGQSHHTHTSSQGHESQSPQGLARIYVSIPRHHPEYESPHYMFILLPYALHDNSLHVYVLLLYKYSSLLYVFH